MPALSVTIGAAAASYAFSGEPTLRDLLLQAGLHTQMPCAGNHSCGKCKVCCSGALSPLSAEEASFLSPGDLSGGIRLACFVRALGDVSVWLAEDRLSTLSAVSLPAHALTERGWGLAVDVGTTTVAMQLYHLDTGDLCGESLQANQQARFGADVISRIEFSNQNGGELLEETLHQQLSEMAGCCMQQAGIQELHAAVVTGNTTMLHFWEGLDPRGIAVAPFTPASLFGGGSRRSLLGTDPYLPPCLGPYIGGDVTCAILAAELLKRPDQTALLADLGTNGEIVLSHGGKLYCASTAMGPAFEGAGLAFGMQATPGAISGIHQEPDGSLSVRVIANCPAVGICGSGVLDAVRVMLDLGILDESGLLCESSPGVTLWNRQTAWRVPGTSVYVTQEDIRQIQLAKAALCAGIHTLLEKVSLSPEDVERFCIAGGFGHYMDLTSAARMGLFPAALASRAEVLGNAALSGAAALLLDSSFHSDLRAARACAQEIPLSGNSVFSEYYIDKIMFESEE